MQLTMLLDENIYRCLTSKKRELDALRLLPKGALDRLRRQFAIELAYNSNAGRLCFLVPR
jgi:hypothetical protein